MKPDGMDLFNENPTIPKVNASAVYSGMVAYRIAQKSKARNISPSLVVKELVVKQLIAEGLLAPNYTLGDMRKGY